MADPNDVRASKQLRSELGRKMIDVTQADVRVMHGVAYIRGVVKGIVGGPTDLKSALLQVGNGLRQKGIVKDVVIDAVYRQ
ncbi:MAG: hypothetical protein IT207_00280 [Fimbriimonadaceae bacterium]|nr:hypothetical protein [Fimbriimonadaceae bacterium]